MKDRGGVPEAAIGGAAYRTEPRESVEDLLLLGGFLFELRADGREAALSSLRRFWSGAATELYDPAEIVNGLIAEGLRGQGEFWRAHYVATGQALVSRLCGSPEGAPPDLAALPPRSFRVGFRRTFGTLPATSLSLRLRMPLPLEGAHLTDLRIEQMSGTVAPGRLEAKLNGPVDGFSLGAKLSFTAHPGLPRFEDESAEDRQIWLAAQEGPIQVTAAVRELADRLAGAKPDPFGQVMAFWDHLFDTMRCGMIHPKLLSGQAATDWVLANGWCDCRLGSALLAALCRARGIPARLIGGYLLWDGPAEHFWMEAWLPDRGWTPFDLIGWGLSAGGRDGNWRNVFAGAVDYRMKTQIFPNIFTGSPGVPMGKARHQLLRTIADGTETRFVSLPDGDLIYSDEIRIFRE